MPSRRSSRTTATWLRSTTHIIISAVCIKRCALHLRWKLGWQIMCGPSKNWPVFLNAKKLRELLETSDGLKNRRNNAKQPCPYSDPLVAAVEACSSANNASLHDLDTRPRRKDVTARYCSPVFLNHPA